MLIRKLGDQDVRDDIVVTAPFWNDLQQWDKKDKTAARKRELEAAAAAASAAPEEAVPRKKPRLEPVNDQVWPLK